MKDTPPGLDRKFQHLLLSRSGEERLKMGCSMHATARKLAQAALLERYPGARPSEIKRLLFLHFYGHEFALEQRNRIASFLAEHGKRNKTTRKRVGRTLQQTEAKISMRVGELPAPPYGAKRLPRRRK